MVDPPSSVSLWKRLHQAELVLAAAPAPSADPQPRHARRARRRPQRPISTCRRGPFSESALRSYLARAGRRRRETGRRPSWPRRGGTTATLTANLTASAATSLLLGAEARSVVSLATGMRRDGSEVRRKRRSSFARSSIRVDRGRASLAERWCDSTTTPVVAGTTC